MNISYYCRLPTFAFPNIEKPARHICRNELWSGQSLCRVILYYLELSLQENTNILNNYLNKHKQQYVSTWYRLPSPDGCMIRSRPRD